MSKVMISKEKMEGTNENEVSCDISVYRNPTNSKAPFTEAENHILQLQGTSTLADVQHNQMEHFLKDMQSMSSGIEKYVHLLNLHTQNEQLFYYIIINKVELTMPIIYTPVVGQACLNFGKIFEKPKGLYINYMDRENIKEKLLQWPFKDIKAICVTDGERILGLGDLGTNGMGIPIGKLMLYTACAKVPPSKCLPITLDMGTNNEAFMKDVYYKGMRRPRITGEKYIQFLDEFMEAVVSCYGHSTLIQFEDFGNHNAFVLLERYREKYCTFNDDIQGTASVTVAGLLATCRLTEKRLGEQIFLFQGAGEAAIGIALLLVQALRSDGLSEEKAISRIWLFDSKGLVVKNRSVGGLNAQKLKFAHEHKEISSLQAAVEVLAPDVLIGVAAVPGAFTTEILEKMYDNHKRPVIFALSNPTSKSECTAEQAYRSTKGRCLFASGSPFDPVTIKRKVCTPSQCNNAYIFPGFALAVIACEIFPVTDGLFLHAAKSLAKMVTAEEQRQGLLFPPLHRIQEVSISLAVSLIEYAYKNNLARFQPEPTAKEAFLHTLLYNPEYTF